MNQLHRRLAKLLAIGFLLIGVFTVPRIPNVSAAGELYVSPGVVTPQPVNTTFSVLVKVAGMDQFIGWTVQMIYDPSVINASTISTTGNIFQANTTGGIVFETINCVNGAGKGCCLTNACSPMDGAGIATSSFGDTKFASGYGLLFNVTFRVVSNKPYSPITTQNDILPNGGRNGAAHSTLSGSYGTAPDFRMSASPPSMDLFVGTSNMTTITLRSVYNFSGPVSLSASSPERGLTVTVSPNQTSLQTNATATCQVKVHVQVNVIATSYTILLTANSSSLPPKSLPHTLPIIISVHTKANFNAYASPSLLLADQSGSNSTTIIVESVNNFTGTVYLTVSGPSSTVFGLDKQTLTLPNGGTASANLAITTQSSILPYKDDFFVNVTSGIIFHVVQVNVVPPPGDFNVSANPPSARIQAGDTEVVTIGVTSMHYFLGTIYLLGSSQSGLQLSFEPAVFYINYSRTVFTKLTITTNTTTTSGDHTIALTVVGQFGQATLPIQHTIAVTLTTFSPAQPQPVPQVPTTFLGLQEPVFFGIIGGLAAILAVVGMFEARHSSRPRISPILEG